MEMIQPEFIFFFIDWCTVRFISLRINWKIQPQETGMVLEPFASDIPLSTLHKSNAREEMIDLLII